MEQNETLSIHPLTVIKGTKVLASGNHRCYTNTTGEQLFFQWHSELILKDNLASDPLFYFHSHHSAFSKNSKG